MQLPSLTSARLQLVASALTMAALAVACADREATTTPAPVVTATSAAAREPATHVVERGETLATIARDTGVPVATLVELNGIADPDLIDAGLVLQLEARPAAPPPSARVTPSDEASDPIVTWLDDRWSEVRPHLVLSRRSIEQGAIAGLLLPVVVLGLVIVGLLSNGMRTITFGVVRRLRGRTPVEAPAAAADPIAEAGGSGRRLRLRAPRIRHHMPSLPSANASRSIRAVASHTSRALTTWLTGAARTAGEAARALRVRVRSNTEARTERRRLDTEQSRQAALRAQWWRPGMEALRIGLLDEADRCFAAGLATARTEGWSEEARLFEESLERVRERRSSAVTAAP